MSENKEMKICGECRYYKNNRCMLPCYAMNHWAENPACHHFEEKTPPTVGDIIRQSSDGELAEKLVYTKYYGDSPHWFSTIFPNYDEHHYLFNTKQEAIEATVEELRKEVNK